MRVVIQRVKNAKVEVNQKNVGSIKQGLLVFLGIEMADTIEDVNWIIKKNNPNSHFLRFRWNYESISS